MIPANTTHPRCLQLEHLVVDFSPSDIQRLKSPMEWLNNICINNGTALLQSHLGGSQSDMIVIISSLVISTLDDGALWRVALCSAFQQKSHWLVPIHRTTPEEHWVLGIIDFTHQEVGLFDSLADESLCKLNIQVWVCHLHHKSY
jgi:Ulp1 family protease